MTTCAAARRVALVRALDDRAQAAAPVGVFELGVEAARAEIHFGGDPRRAQGRDEALVVGHMVAVEHGDDDRAGLCGAGDDRTVDRAQRRQQARDADRKAGRRNRLGAKARHQPVVAPAAADRAEADRLAVLARVSKVSSASKTGPV